MFYHGEWLGLDENFSLVEWLTRLYCYFAGTTGGILVCAFVMDVVVWYKAKSITFVDETEEGTVEEMVNLKKSDQRPAENDYL